MIRRLLLAIASFAAAAALVAVPRPAPAQFFGGAAIDNIKCETMEGAAQHIHAHLALFQNGRAVTIPSSVGIPAGLGCLYWVHTHSNDGLIHIEAPVTRAFTLGDFFDIWGKDLTPSVADGVRAAKGARLTVSVNGKPYAGDPRRIVLKDHQEILIAAGAPPAHPATYQWKNF